MTPSDTSSPAPSARATSAPDSLRGPNFFIVGAPKCGTTSLYTYLSSHPDVFFPPDVKEPHHYNSDMPHFQWYNNRADYLSLFACPEAQAARVIGEASVQYLYSTEAAANIARDAPKARIMICLRRPAPFIRSYHNQMLVNLDEDLEALGAAWAASGQPRAVARDPRMLDYKSVGFFTEQIARYRAVFPDEQIRILTLEEFTADPRGHYLALLDWLGLADDGRHAFERVHGAVTPRSRKLSIFLKSPPPWARTLTGGIKHALGLQSLGLARVAAWGNKAKGYAATSLTPDLAEEIIAHYSEDQSALDAYRTLWLRP